MEDDESPPKQGAAIKSATATRPGRAPLLLALAPERKGEVVASDPTKPHTLVLAASGDLFSSAAAITLQHLAWERLRRTPTLYAIDPQQTLLDGGYMEGKEALVRARTKLKAGQEAYENLDLDGAVRLMEESVDAYIEGLPALGDFDEFASAQARLGATRFFAGDPEGAQRAFSDSVLIAPTHKPDPAVFSPELLAAYEEAREAVKSAPTGVLTVTTSPQEAEVWVDGHFQGTSPESIENIGIGNHYIVARKLGREATADIATVVPADPVTLELGLRPGKRSDSFASMLREAMKDAGDRELPDSVKLLAGYFGASRIVLLKLSTKESELQITATSYDVESAARNAESELTLAPLTGSGRKAAVNFMDGLLAQVAPKAVPPPAVTFWQSLPPYTHTWWFWTATGATLAAIGGGIAVAATASPEGPPRSRRFNLLGIP